MDAVCGRQEAADANQRALEIDFAQTRQRLRSEATLGDVACIVRDGAALRASHVKTFVCTVLRSLVVCRARLSHLPSFEVTDDASVVRSGI